MVSRTEAMLGAVLIVAGLIMFDVALLARRHRS